MIEDTERAESAHEHPYPSQAQVDEAKVNLLGATLNPDPALSADEGETEFQALIARATNAEQALRAAREEADAGKAHAQRADKAEANLAEALAEIERLKGKPADATAPAKTVEKPATATKTKPA